LKFSVFHVIVKSIQFNMQIKIKRAAIYARVSTERQEKERIIESQLAELREICKKKMELKLLRNTLIMALVVLH